jgi:hypothetical protein
MLDPAIAAQIAPYRPWLIIAGVCILFILLRLTRKGLRRRIDEFGYRLMRERGLLIWFWLNAPGVIIHELSHALVVLLFAPFGFRITSITFFRIKPIVQPSNGRVNRSSGRQSLQLGEVQYVRPQGRFVSYVGDGLSGVAPLFGGIAMFILLYWAATGYNLWDGPFTACQQLHSTCLQLQVQRPNWPWWTLTFTPYLILTVTSALWPSRQDWRGARWVVVTVFLLAALGLGLLWYLHYANMLLQVSTFIASRVGFALIVLLLLDFVFLIIAELLVRMMRH